MRKHSQEDIELASKLVRWLGSNGCTVSLLYKDDGIHVMFTLNLDTKPQPPIRVNDGKIVFPTGSQIAVVEAFFSPSPEPDAQHSHLHDGERIPRRR